MLISVSYKSLSGFRIFDSVWSLKEFKDNWDWLKKHWVWCHVFIGSKEFVWYKGKGWIEL